MGRIGLGLMLFLGGHIEGSQVVTTDVCVYGGGSGGVTAAVQAARLGKSVALVVFNNHLGGMTSSGLGETDLGSNGTAYIQGLTREFYDRIGVQYGKSVATFTFEPHVAEAVFDQMAQEAGVSVYYNEELGTTAMNGTQISGITMLSGDVFRAKMYIDASYEGDLLKQAGVSYTVGRESSAQYGESLAGIQSADPYQPLPAGVDPYVTEGNPSSGLLLGVNADSGGALGSADQKIQAYCYRMCLTKVTTNRVMVAQPAGYNESDYELLFRCVAAGQTNNFWSYQSMPNGKTDSNNAAGMSTDFIGMSSGYPEANYATRAQIALAHKNWQLGLIWTLQNSPRIPQAVRTTWGQWGLAADEFTDTGNWPPQLYVRESRRMISDYVMTEQNCLATTVAADSVGLASYGFDSHDMQRIVSNGFVQNEGQLRANVAAPYPISYRSIVPKVGQCSNLLVPWCLSASHVAFSSIRMEPVYMILGQSAGTAASLAIDDGVDVQDVSYPELRNQLLAEGQALGTSSGANFASLFFQKGTSLGFLDLNTTFLPSAWQGVGSVGSGWQERAVADVNGDGVPDIIFQNGTLLGAILLDSTGNAVSWIGIGSMNAGWQLRGAGQISGDGNLDLVFQNGTLVGYLEIDNSGAPQSWSGIGAVGSGWELHALSDLNFDGRPELLFQNGTSVAALQLGASGGASVWHVIGAVNPGWVLSDAVDVNGDGQPDLIFQNGASLGALKVSTAFLPTAWYGIGGVEAGWVLPGDF